MMKKKKANTMMIMKMVMMTMTDMTKLIMMKIMTIMIIKSTQKKKTLNNITIKQIRKIKLKIKVSKSIIKNLINTIQKL